MIRLAFASAGRPVIVVVRDDDGMAELIAGCFRPYLIGASDSDAPPDLVVSAAADGWVLEPASGRRGEARTVTEVLEKAEFVLTELLLETMSGLPHLHASGCVVGDRAVLALGASGAGKSSLGFHWSAAGIPVLGDDIVPLDAHGHALPFHRIFSVHHGRVREAGGDLSLTQLWEEGSEEAWYDPVAGGGWAEPAPVGTIALIRRGPGSELAVRELKRAEGLQALVDGLLESGTPASTAFPTLFEVINGARVLELSYESSRKAAAFLVREAE